MNDAQIMKTAHYIGNHAADTWTVRLGWKMTRSVQRGQFAQVTHVEAIHAEHGGGLVTMASSSLRKEGFPPKSGVRSKTVQLSKENWRIFDMPDWDVERSIDLLHATKENLYDKRGALASAVPLPSFIVDLKQEADRWYCNEWVGYPFLGDDSGIFGPAQFTSIILMLGGREVTDSFW